MLGSCHRVYYYATPVLLPLSPSIYLFPPLHPPPPLISPNRTPFIRWLPMNEVGPCHVTPFASFSLQGPEKQVPGIGRPPPFPLQRAPLGPVPTGRGGARRGRAGCRSKLVDSESCPWLSPICISNINGHVALWSLAFCTPTAGGGTYQGQYLSRDSSSGDHPPDRS